MQWLEPNKGYGSALGKVLYAFEPGSETTVIGGKGVKCSTGQKLAQKVYFLELFISVEPNVVRTIKGAMTFLLRLVIEQKTSTNPKLAQQRRQIAQTCK